MIFCFLFCTCNAQGLSEVKIFSQQVYIGGGLSLSAKNKNLSTGGGLNLHLEYKPYKLFSFRGQYNIVFSEYSNFYLTGYDDVLTSVDVAFLYYPFDFNVEPYCGLDLGYYHHKASQSGNTHITNVINNDIENKVGFGLIGGIRLHSFAIVSLGLELRYIFLNTDVETTFEDQVTFNEYTESRNINLNSVFLNLYVSIRL
ncbi:MAG: hypothetical protein C4539_19950 [Ignavibacteriales bacterium]|nr:MAG: hypothetical protein C4539_19950 [Ignavibacteriales bacterium]